MAPSRRESQDSKKDLRAFDSVEQEDELGDETAEAAEEGWGSLEEGLDLTETREQQVEEAEPKAAEAMYKPCDNCLGQQNGTEQARKPCVKRAPRASTKQEGEEHDATGHAQSQAWCKYCVRGRGRSCPRMTTQDNAGGEGTVPKVSMDYFYMSKEEERAMANPFITMLDESSGEKFARATGQKGLGNKKELDWLIVDMSEQLKA